MILWLLMQKRMTVYAWRDLPDHSDIIWTKLPVVGSSSRIQNTCDLPTRNLHSSVFIEAALLAIIFEMSSGTNLQADVEQFSFTFVFS